MDSKIPPVSTPSPRPLISAGVASMPTILASGYCASTSRPVSDMNVRASSIMIRSAFGLWLILNNVSMLDTCTGCQRSRLCPPISTPCSIPSLVNRRLMS